MLKGRFPDFTPAQVVAAFFAALYPLLTLLGADLSSESKDALEELKYVALGLFGADAAIRVGRNLGNSYPPSDPTDDLLEDLPEEVPGFRESVGTAQSPVHSVDPGVDEPMPEGAIAGKFGEQK